MYFDDNENKSNLNVFFFISIIVHAIIFILVPNLDGLINYGSDGFAQGGVIRVIYSQTGTAKELSPVVDPTSKTTSPQVEQPRPANEPPKPNAVSTPVRPESQDNIVPPVQPRPQVEAEAKPLQVKEPEQPKEVQPVVEPKSGDLPKAEQIVADELLTSETGREIYVEPVEPAVVTDVKPQVESPIVDESPVEETEEIVSEPQVDSGPSGSGDSPIGGSSDGAGSIQESGAGNAEVASAPPSPPAASDVLNLRGNGGLAYPKNAVSDGAEGIVLLQITVAPAGNVLDVSIIQSSGDSRLDRQAQLTFANAWEFNGADLTYILDVKVEFSITHGVMITPLSIRWAE